MSVFLIIFLLIDQISVAVQNSQSIPIAYGRGYYRVSRILFWQNYDEYIFWTVDFLWMGFCMFQSKDLAIHTSLFFSYHSFLDSFLSFTFLLLFKDGLPIPIIPLSFLLFNSLFWCLILS